MPEFLSRCTVVRRQKPPLLMEAIVDHVVVHLASALDQECLKPLGMATGRTMEPFYGALIQRLAAWPVPSHSSCQLWQAWNWLVV